jgi:tetratricopeptide (TPR) repeat protein
VILFQTVIILISFFVVSLIGFGDADAQEKDSVTNATRALIEKGIILYELGEYNEAIGYYDKALAIDPNQSTI